MLEDIVALHNSSTQAEILFPGDDREKNFVKVLSSLSQLQRDHPKWQALVQFAVVGAIVMGMQACAPALAEVVGPEVASEQSSAGIFSNLGDIQSGFASVCSLSLCTNTKPLSDYSNFCSLRKTPRSSSHCSRCLCCGTNATTICSPHSEWEHTVM